MCQICSAFNPTLTGCTYQDLIGQDLIGQDQSVAQNLGTVNATGETVVEEADASADTSTSAEMAVGAYFMGALSSGAESDWIEITLEAGTYTLAAVGVGALNTAVNDITLTLRNAAGNYVDYDDSNGPGLNADITVAVSEPTTFYIDVGSYNFTDSGTYGVSVTQGTVASFNADMGAGNLLRPNQAWVTTPGTEVSLTWAIRASGNDPLNNSPSIAMNANQIALTEAAMAYVDAISGLNFTQVATGGTSNNAAMLFGAYEANDGSGAYAYYPGSNGGNTNANALQGDVWLNNTSFYPGQTYGSGTYTGYTMLHEIGHAIGLAHPGDYNATPGVHFTYNNHAQFLQDSQQYTVMSYFGETNTGVSYGLGYPDTFMLYDFMAIHQLYGAGVNYNAGNTIYGFNATEAGSVYDFTTNTTPLMTVYDGQGTDTIDLSGYAMGQWLTLQEGEFSNLGGYVGNFSIAMGAVIENAFGGSGADTISGNGAANVIDGGAGADSLSGGAGDDTLHGGSEFDYLDGGDGRDSIVGGMGNDTLIGGGQNDRLSGGNGNDLILGEMGADRLIGGRGHDTLDGGNRNDKLIGGEGDDSLFGGAGNDMLRGGSQSDYLKGDAGDDVLFGGAGHDTLIGGAGNDTMTGNFNADTFIFFDGHGDDAITDFEATNDFEKIDFSGLSTLNSLSEVLGTGSGTAAATQVGGDVAITTGGGTIMLESVNFADLDAQDFIF